MDQSLLDNSQITAKKWLGEVGKQKICHMEKK